VLVAERTAEITRQKEELESTLTELRNAQTQLIQSEKMASLGELTAGIAHEIQNPLNFVNNFSELSLELVAEMKEELTRGDPEEAMAIADDIFGNLEKIHQHGKRADATVKGMLLHSRTGTGTKEPTPVNALADEYLRLSYHGLRAKDKAFNARLVTDFDEHIGEMNLIPQDMGRVFLNLFTNAFYAVNKKRSEGRGEEVSGAYEPEVSVKTKKHGRHVEIRIRDNGTGIPAGIVDKIYQPFFTTKPTGEGTGLGLSLSYDIITKSFGGQLKVDTREGEFTEFIIHLPL
jgi:signal transduction histidine kinase